MKNDRQIDEYESMTSDLLQWISMQVELLDDHNFANSLAGVQEDHKKFIHYRTNEKPIKFVNNSKLI